MADSHAPGPRDDASCRRGTGRTRGDRKLEDERYRLLSAAMEVLQRSGWWGFKIESVLKQAGLSTRSFYRHFESKGDLLFSLLENQLAGSAILLARRTAAEASPSARVRAYIDTTLDMADIEVVTKPSSLFAAHWREMMAEHPVEFRHLVRTQIEPLIAAISDGIETGELISQDPEADAAAVFFLVAGMAADHAMLAGQTDRAQVLDIVMPLITRGLGLRDPD